MLFRSQIHITVNTGETEEILILAPASARPFENLRSQFIFALFQIRGQFKLGKGKVKITLLKDGTALQSTEGVLDGETQFVLKVDHPELWSAETPVLYDLLLEVTAEDGTVQELIPQRVGFRRFEMKDHIMMLNGKRVVFKGVNRHEFSSVSGRVVSREELIKDLTTMKQNNINALRDHVKTVFIAQIINADRIRVMAGTDCIDVVLFHRRQVFT